VDVRVDEAGHERAAPRIDATCLGRPDLALRDLGDAFSLHEHGVPGQRGAPLEIEERAVSEEDLGHHAQYYHASDPEQ
jgi:hypothetical protein